MKKTILAFMLGVLISGLFAFKMTYEPNKSTAEAKQIQGVYVFFCSEPIKETDYLGTVNVYVTISSDSDSRLNAMIKKVKKEYPDAEAIIFKNIDFGSCDAVKFK